MTKLVHSKSEYRRLKEMGADVQLMTPQPGDDDLGIRPKVNTNLEQSPDEFQLPARTCDINDPDCEACQ